MVDQYRHDPAPGRHPSLVERLTEHRRYWRDVQQMDIPEADEVARIAVKFINAELYSKPSPYARCSICGAPLDVPGRPWSENCGGDCVVCMADAGDPECVAVVEAMRAGEAVVRASRRLLRSMGTPLMGGRPSVSDELLTLLSDALPPGKGDQE